MTISERVQQYAGGIIVLRDLDYSRDSGFWLVPMTGKELETWWLSQETFESNPEGSDVDMLYKWFLNKTPPPYSKIDIPGELLVAESEEDNDLWVRMAANHNHYFCNICCNDDSYLKRPDGKILHHKGFREPLT